MTTHVPVEWESLQECWRDEMFSRVVQFLRFGNKWKQVELFANDVFANKKSAEFPNFGKCPQNHLGRNIGNCCQLVAMPYIGKSQCSCFRHWWEYEVGICSQEILRCVSFHYFLKSSRGWVTLQLTQESNTSDEGTFSHYVQKPIPLNPLSSAVHFVCKNLNDIDQYAYKTFFIVLPILTIYLVYFYSANVTCLVVPVLFLNGRESTSFTEISILG